MDANVKVMNTVIDSVIEAQRVMETKLRELKKEKTGRILREGGGILKDVGKEVVGFVLPLPSVIPKWPNYLTAGLTLGRTYKTAKGWFQKNEVDDKIKKEFKTFISLFIDKIDQHSDSFGPSAKMSKLIQQYKSDLVTGKLESRGIKELKNPIGSLVKGFWLKSLFIIGIIIIISACILAAILSNVGNDSSIFGPSFLIFVITYVITNYIVYSRDGAAVREEQRLYDDAYDAYLKYRKAIETYYDNILQKVNPSGGVSNLVDIDPNLFKSHVFAINEYKQFWRERYQKVRRKVTKQ